MVHDDDIAGHDEGVEALIGVGKVVGQMRGESLDVVAPRRVHDALWADDQGPAFVGAGADHFERGAGFAGAGVAEVGHGIAAEDEIDIVSLVFVEWGDHFIIHHSPSLLISMW